MRRREPPRVLGPYLERNKWRIVVVENGARKSIFVTIEAEALRLKRQYEGEITVTEVRTVRGALAEFLRHRVDSGKAQPKSAHYYRERLTGLFGKALEFDLVALTPRRAAALYERASQRTYRGRPIAAASHQSQLMIAKILGKWAVRRGYLRVNPFANVEAIGKANRGKAQLRIDEARLFIDCALQRFNEGDLMALAPIIALTMGLRASEIMGCRMRDLDNGGRTLWIEAGKTINACRRPEVPEFVRPCLQQLAAGLAPDAYLFGTTRSGGPRERDLVRDATHRVCRQAGVPIVCAHSLRGLYATLGVKSGGVPELVAASLGHGSFAVTKRHYAQASAIEAAQSARVLATLDLDDHKPAVTQPSAEDLLRALPIETLARLVELAVRQAQSGQAPLVQ